MPFLAPSVTDERDALASFLEQQVAQLRVTAFELTDEQARQTHAPSSLSIAGLVAHTAHVVRHWLEQVRVAPERVDAAREAELTDELGLPGAFTGSEVSDLPLDDVLAALDRAAASIRPIIANADLEARVPVPEAPWFPPELESWNVRWVCQNLICEVARHVGHADLIREAIDGEIAYSLNARAEGETFDWQAYQE